MPPSHAFLYLPACVHACFSHQVEDVEAEQQRLIKKHLMDDVVAEVDDEDESDDKLRRTTHDQFDATR